MAPTDRQLLAFLDALGEALVARQSARRGPKAIGSRPRGAPSDCSPRCCPPCPGKRRWM